jgi:hypothetical protein
LPIAAWRLMHVVHDSDPAPPVWDGRQQILGAACEREKDTPRVLARPRIAPDWSGYQRTAWNNWRMPERLEVQRAVAASAKDIFAVLTDPRGHVAIDSSGMLMAASGEVVTKAGDTFVVHMDREALNDYPLGLYDVTVEIVKFQPDQEIAWTVHGQLDLGHVYGYRLEPIEQGTLVTSYYDWSAAEQAWKDAAIFPVIPESALRATLGILARTVAPGRPRPMLPAQ